MKSIILIPALLLSFLQLGCKNGTATTDTGKIPDLESSGPETASRNTDFAPAFDGQTRVKGIKTSTAFEVDILAAFPAKEEIRYIDDTVDYTKIYELVKAIFMQRQKLLETVAQNIATAIETEFGNLQQLQISITKLTPPISSFVGTVGITYSKEY